ncbi:hypothetical protein NEIMUCOT_05450 [Neisseria mucosa ATCC 25996]|uniref:Uncharacterized protein n=1 Tax=Neisseria mucosa (strain ATCC 25996 / DSM 4631 / NCTC 10774 / M26) TaxID=546266 RepID=D2ZXU6_NEIM2|nr:hypothetical protein NEIMUCOT_05450 [Neisseria mucosa ATCC 25996]
MHTVRFFNLKCAGFHCQPKRTANLRQPQYSRLTKIRTRRRSRRQYK